MASTRSGRKYIPYNKPFFSSKHQLLSCHRRLTSQIPAIETRTYFVANSKFSLSETTARFHHSNEPKFIRQVLKRAINTLKGGDLGVSAPLQSSSSSSSSSSLKWHFEVNVTFNAILHNPDLDSWSVFYGLDYATNNHTGIKKELSYGDTIVINQPKDIAKIPTSFDMTDVVKKCRFGFSNSNVYVHSILNIVYLMYKLQQ